MTAVERAKRADPGDAGKADARLLVALRGLLLDRIPRDPLVPVFRQGNTLGRERRHWFRAKFGGNRFRLFFRADSRARVIAYVRVEGAQAVVSPLCLEAGGRFFLAPVLLRLQPSRDVQQRAEQGGRRLPVRLDGSGTDGSARRVACPARYCPREDHSRAATVRKVQGVTVRRAHVEASWMATALLTAVF